MKSLSLSPLLTFFFILISGLFPTTAACANPWMSDYTLIGSYPGAYNGADPLEVYGILDQNGEYGIAIELSPILNNDKNNKFLLVRDFELPSFLTALKTVRDKSREWTKIAKENNVRDYSKLYDIDCIDLHGLTTPGFNKGAGLWNCKIQNICTHFFITYGNFIYKISFFGTGESGDAKRKEDFFDLEFHNLNQLDKLINIIEPTNVKSQLGLGNSTHSTPSTNYDSLFK